MVDPGIGGFQKLTQQIGTQAAGAGGGAGGVAGQPASAEDVTRFQEAMKLGGEGFQAQPTGAASLQAPGSSTPWNQPRSGGMGASILKGLEGISDRRSSLMKQIQDISSGTSAGKVGFQSMMELQFKIAQMTTEQEIVGKIAGQISQGAQTLFRNQ